MRISSKSQEGALQACTAVIAGNLLGASWEQRANEKCCGCLVPQSAWCMSESALSLMKDVSHPQMNLCFRLSPKYIISSKTQ